MYVPYYVQVYLTDSLDGCSEVQVNWNGIIRFDV